MTTPGNIVERSLKSQVPTDELMRRFEELFTDDLCRDLERQAPSTKRAHLSVKVLVICVLYFVVARLSSFCQAHSTLRRSGIWSCPPIQVTKQAFFQRFVFFSDGIMLWLIQRLAAQFRKKAAPFAAEHPAQQWAQFAHQLLSIDDCVLDMIIRKYFVRQQPPDNDLILDSLPGRISVLFEVCSGLIAEVEFHDDPQENEKNHARSLIERLPAGCLVLFDLGYFSFPFFDWLTDHFTYFISRMKARASYEVLHTFLDTPAVRDRLIYLGKHRADRAAYPLRFVEIFVDGKWWGYVTNVLDPTMLPGHHLFALYDQRWSIERCFSVLKGILGLSQLRLCHLQGVKWQLWGTILAYQVVQTLRLELAALLQVQPSQLSWHQFFAAHSAYYREAAGRTRLSVLAWIVRHHQSLGIIKIPRKSEKKVGPLPEAVGKAYAGLSPQFPQHLKPRKPRYARRNCARGKNRNSKTHHKKIIVGTQPKKKKRKNHE